MNAATLYHADAIDFLTYRCYCYNRRISPDVAPERWGKLFPNWQAMEARYQSEVSK